MQQQYAQVVSLLAIFFVLSEGSSLCSLSTQKDIEDILKLVPWSKVRAITYGYLENDNQVQAAYKYLRSENFLQQLLQLEKTTQFSQVVSYLKQSGVDVFSLVYSVHKMASPPAHLPVDASSARPGGAGVAQLVRDILGVLPKLALRALFDIKLDSSDDLRSTVVRLAAGRTQSLLKNLTETPELHNLEQTLASNYIHLGKIANIVKNDFINDDD